jgi:hypothetical protein
MCPVSTGGGDEGEGRCSRPKDERARPAPLHQRSPERPWSHFVLSCILTLRPRRAASGRRWGARARCYPLCTRPCATTRSRSAGLRGSGRCPSTDRSGMALRRALRAPGAATAPTTVSRRATTTPSRAAGSRSSGRCAPPARAALPRRRRHRAGSLRDGVALGCGGMRRA